MTEPQRGFIQQGKLLAIYVLFLSILMGGIGLLLISNHKRLLSHEEARRAETELILVSEFIQDSLIRHDYAETREFLKSWVRTRSTVLKLRAYFKNGFELVDYVASDYDDDHGVLSSHTIEFGDNTLTIEITRSTSYVYGIIGKFKNELLVEAFLIVVFIGASLWIIMIKYSISPMERQLLDSADALAASEQVYRSVASNIPNGAVLITDKRLNCLFAEGKGLHELDVDPESITGKNLEMFLGPDTKEKVTPLIEKALQGELADSDDIIVRGKNLWVQAIPLPSDDGRAERALILTQNVTERNNLLKEVLAAQESAEAANRAKSEFLANMSHEIRTPMNAILGYTELLRTERDDKHKNDYLKGITSAGKNLLNIINDILDLSKIEAGKLVMSYEPISIKDIAQDTIYVFLASAEAKGLTLRLELTGDIPEYVFIDETRLQQILVNLVGNAVKFTGEGFVILSVDSVLIDDGYIKLTIRIKDSGIGIPKQQMDKIFESFTQQDGQDTRKFGGTGLGLTITRKLTEMMGGEISVHSEPGQGTEFTLVFDGLKIAEPDKIERVKTALPNIDFMPATVLVVDDVESNRLIVRNFLRDYSVTVMEAENGLEGMDLALKIKPDIVLMDIQMPVMDGYETTAKMRNNDRLKSIPVIAVTASIYGDTEKVKREMDGYLSKPFSKSDLVTELARFLPYRHVNSTRTREAEDNEECPSGFKGLSDSEKRMIREKFTEEFSDVMSLMITQDVIDFADKLASFCSKHDIGPALKCAGKLHVLASAFKIDEVETLLKDMNRTIFEI